MVDQVELPPCPFCGSLLSDMERIRKLALAGEGPTFDLILSIADAALAHPNTGRV